MAELQRLLGSAGIDPDAAPKLLAIAATYLRRGEALPPDLATYLAVAFEKTANQPKGEQVDALKHGLGLGVVTGASRKPIDTLDLILTVADYGEEEAELGMRAALAEIYGFSKNTAKARIKETRGKLVEARKHLGNIKMRKRGE